MLTVFIGENTVARDKALKAYINNFVGSNGDMALDKLNADDLKLTDLIDAVTTVPFLSDKRMVVLKYLSTNKELADKIDVVATRVADSTDLVLVETAVDNRGLYSKNLKKLADNYNSYSSLDGIELADWAVSEASSVGGNLTKNDAMYLADRLGHNQQIISSEIHKLVLVDKNITKQTIEEMTAASPHSSVFNMIDSLMQGRIDKASTLYDEQRAQGMEPQAIMGMITWQLLILANIVAAGNEPADVIAKKAKISPFVVRKNLNLASNLSRRKMVQILDLAIEADLKTKTGKVKPDAGVHTLLLEIASLIK